MYGQYNGRDQGPCRKYFLALASAATDFIARGTQCVKETK
jgi:hypothetical protein